MFPGGLGGTSEGDWVRVGGTSVKSCLKLLSTFVTYDEGEGREIVRIRVSESE